SRRPWPAGYGRQSSRYCPDLLPPRHRAVPAHRRLGPGNPAAVLTPAHAAPQTDPAQGPAPAAAGGTVPRPVPVATADTCPSGRWRPDSLSVLTGPKLLWHSAR